MATRASGLRPRGDEVMGKLVGAAVQFGIAELPVFEDHRDRIGSLFRLRLEQLMDIFVRPGTRLAWRSTP